MNYSRNKRKRFYKLKKLRTYEHDCKIYYPTEWDDDYLAYKEYCRQCSAWQIPSPISSPSTVFLYDALTLQFLKEVPIYRVRTFFCEYGAHLPIMHGPYEYSSLTPFNDANIIHNYDSNLNRIQPVAVDNFEETYVDTENIVIRASRDMYNFQISDHGSVEFRDYEIHDRKFRRQPTQINLGAFISHKLETKRNVLKQRKRTQRFTKVESINRRAKSNIYKAKSFVDSNVNAKDRILEDQVPQDDVNIIKMTCSQTICCHLSEYRLIGPSTSNVEVDLHKNEIETVLDQTPTEDVQFYRSFSQVVSCNSPKSCVSNHTNSIEEIYINTARFNNSLESIPSHDFQTFSQAVTSGTICPEEIDTNSMQLENPYVSCSLFEVRVIHKTSSTKINTWTTQTDKRNFVPSETTTERVIYSNIQSAPTWSQIVSGAKNDLNTKTKLCKPKATKFNKSKQCRFKKCDILSSPIEEKTVESNRTKPSFISYADIIKTRKPDKSGCIRTVPEQSEVLKDTQPKYQSYVDTVKGVRQDSVVPNITPQLSTAFSIIETNPSIAQNESLPVENNVPVPLTDEDECMWEVHVPPVSKEKWTKKKSKHKRSKQNKK